MDFSYLSVRVPFLVLYLDFHIPIPIPIFYVSVLFHVINIPYVLSFAFDLPIPDLLYLSLSYHQHFLGAEYSPYLAL